MRFIMD